MAFFGQKTALLLNSPSKSNKCVFARFLKKKADGTWEKPSKKEGLVVKLNLLELIAIRDVLLGVIPTFRAFHSYNRSKTPISFYWNSEEKTDDQKIADDFIWFSAGEYSRPIRYPETVLLKELLIHIIQEKIEFATNNQNESGEDKQARTNHSNRIEKKLIENRRQDSISPRIIRKNKSAHMEDNLPKNCLKADQVPIEEKLSKGIVAKILRKSPKALLLQLKGGKEFWTPKSMIYSPYDENFRELQEFSVANWLLKKKEIIA